MGPKGRKFSVSNFFGFGGTKDVSRSATFTATSAAQADAFREDTKVQQRTSTRPLSMMQPSNSSESQNGKESAAELEPILNFLNSTSQKLYHEGYFHIFEDTDVDGKTLTKERTWKICFAQLSGTNLSLWDSAELEVAGKEGVGRLVVPKYLNLTDSTMKMIKDLPTRDGRGIPLKNVLCISTAGENRFLFNFESFHSMAQWTAAIRLAMFENVSLLEAYTGSLLAGKARAISSLKEILAKTSATTEDWVQVRFASGKPWQKVYCVITPPDEKEFQRRKKAMQKEQQMGQETTIPYLTGEIKLYKTNKKIKKTTPFAAIKSAYACYAIFPERKEMIEYSSLIKIEGTIEFYGANANVLEGNVFLWPDPHPGTPNMELMLKWLVRSYDVLGLYGRPGRLIADNTNPRSIMFAMSSEQRTILEVPDVAHMLINEVTSNTTEAEIRQRLKELTKERLMGPRNRNSAVDPKTGNVAFDDGRSSASSSPAHPNEYAQNQYGLNSASRSTPSLYRQMRPTSMIDTGPKTDAGPNKKFNRFSHQPLSSPQGGFTNGFHSVALERSEEDDEDLFAPPVRANLMPPTDVPTTPIMQHAPSARPANPPTPIGAPPLRRISNGTLMAMGVDMASMAGRGSEPSQSDGYFPHVAAPKAPADRNSLTLQTPMIPGGHRRALYTPPLLDQYNGPPSSGTVSPVEPIRAYNNAADSGNLPSPKPVRPVESLHVVEDVEAAAKRASVPPPPLPQLPASLDDNFAHSLEDDLFSWNKKPTTEQLSNGPLSPPVPAKLSLSASPVGQQEEKTPVLQTPAHQSQQYEEEEPTVDKELSQLFRDAEQLQRTTTNSDAASTRTYDTVTSDDYASTIDSNEGKSPPRREIAPRFGTMRTVGTLPPLVPPPSEVVIGDAKYRPTTAEEQADQKISVDIPKVDFGKTVSHVRTLSAETIGPSYTQGNVNRVSHFANMHGFGNEVQRKTSPNAADTKRLSTYSGGNAPRESQRRSPGPGMGESSKRNSQYGSTTPQEYRNAYLLARPKDANQRKASDDSSGGKSGGNSGGNNTNSSQSSDSGQQNRRSMAWAPGLVQTSASRPQADRTQSAQQFVQNKSDEAQADARRRAQRRFSTNALATASNASVQGTAAPVPYAQPPPRPRSRGGNAAFTPNGLVSQSQDYSSHLSAREQEFLAKQTGTTLLQINKVKQPPHQAGLLGLLETREGEKERMKTATWNGGVDPNSLNNATLNQALAQRQSIRQQQDRQTLIQEQERMAQQYQQQQQQNRQSMMSLQDMYANRGGTPGPAVDPRQMYQERSRTPSSHSMLGGRVQSSDQMQYAHQSTYQPQHVTQYQQYHQAQQRNSVYGAPNQRQSMLPGQYQTLEQQQAQQQQAPQLAIYQQQMQLGQLQQQLFQQQQMQLPMQNQMVNMSNQQIGYQPGYQSVQTPQPYQVSHGYLPPQSPPPPQQYSQYGGR